MNPGVDPRLTELKSDGKIGKKLVSQLIQTHKHGNSVTFQTHLFWCRPCFFLGAKENTDLHHNIRPTGLASHHLFYFGHVLTLFIYSYIMLHRYLLPAPQDLPFPTDRGSTKNLTVKQLHKTNIYSYTYCTRKEITYNSFNLQLLNSGIHFRDMTNTKIHRQLLPTTSHHK